MARPPEAYGCTRLTRNGCQLGTELRIYPLRQREDAIVVKAECVQHVRRNGVRIGYREQARVQSAKNFEHGKAQVLRRVGVRAGEAPEQRILRRELVIHASLAE